MASTLNTKQTNISPLRIGTTFIFVAAISGVAIAHLLNGAWRYRSGDIAVAAAAAGLILSLAALVSGAFGVYGHRATMAIKSCSMAILLASLGAMVGGCTGGSNANGGGVGTSEIETVSINWNPASITPNQPLTVTVAVVLLNGPGSPGPVATGTVELTSGTYDSGALNMCTTAGPSCTPGSISIIIPGNSLPVGLDALYATYTPATTLAGSWVPDTDWENVRVNPSSLLTPTVTVTPTPSSITTAQSLSVGVSVTGTAGTPTGSVVLTSGGYTSPSTLLNGGAATIDITAGSLGAGNDSLTVTYTPDTNSSSIYSGATGGVMLDVSPVGTTSIALTNPNGLAVDSKNRLYVANNGGSQVLVYTETLNSSSVVTALTQVATITTNINSPTRLAFDASGYLYVANAGNNTVSVYDTSFNPVPTGTISTGISRPLGIAVDQSGNVYVGNNSANNITVYTGSPAGGFTLSATLTGDSAGNQFLAPGDITFNQNPFGNLLFVGLGPSTSTDSVLVYVAPLGAESQPLASFTNNNCSTGPSGPTGVTVNVAGGDLFISSFYDSSVTEYTYTGQQNGDCPAPLSISGSNSQIANPEGVAIDSHGNVFVSNSSANTVTVYNPIASAPVYTQH